MGVAGLCALGSGRVEARIGTAAAPSNAPGTTQDTQVLAGGIALTGDPEIPRPLGAAKVPHRSPLALGYAGWGPGQLEAELQTGAWVPVPADPTLLFDDKHDTK